jgi:excisionase family DNA binding protein
MVDHELLTPDEAARYLRVNPQTVYRLLRGGRCPGVKIGRQWRIRKTDLDAHLCGQTTLAANGAASLVPATDPPTTDALAPRSTR